MSAALQWAPSPRLLPTIEAQVAHGFSSATTQVLLAPEIIWLIDMNHFSVKLAVPVTLQVDDVGVGIIAGIDWQG
jgi:hypothetical protein